MRIESIGSTAASGTSTSSSAASASGLAASPSKSSASTTTPVDPVTGDPVPPKYPWISRLTRALEEIAQKDKASPFKPAEIAGETLNKLV